MLRLITNSKFVGSSIGKLAGFAPRKTLPTRRPVCRHMSSRIGPYDRSYLSPSPFDVL